MSLHRYAVPVDATHWNVPGVETDVSFSWEYDNGRERMLNLYEKGKEKQWNATTRIDWNQPFDPKDPLVMPNEVMPIFGSDQWNAMSEDAQAEARKHMIAWTSSQFLHGEQGALICSAKIVETVPDIDSKFYAATQVVDEARHVETYGRYINEKIQMAYPINDSLQSLIEDTISDRRWDFTYLGMQVLIEGVALAAFSMVRDFTQDPTGRAVTAYIMQDEARHVAFGRMALKDAYQDLTEAERRDREEFVIEGSHLLRDRFLAGEVWENLGLPREEMVAFVDQAQIYSHFRKALFSRVVPCVKDIGLWSERVQKAYADLGVLEFADLDLDQMSEDDDRIAEEMERLLAEREEGQPIVDDGSRAAALANTMAHADT